MDKVYMTYVQAMTGHGGWPLSAWLTPELKPFFGGTYFPPEDRHGRMGFPSLLNAIAKGWATDRAKLVAEGDRVVGLLAENAKGQTPKAGESGVPDLHDTGGAAFETCFEYFNENFDAHHGGFGGAPKFPRASNLNFLFRAAAIQGVGSPAGQEAVRMATTTLQRMAEGGVHDHVGGGFHRYSVDEAWFVPHFEKMLYDQAQIAVNCLDAHLAAGDERFAWLARDIFDYTLRDLAAPGGAFLSAEDADSFLAHGKPEHAEGAFYVWTRDEIVAVLKNDAAFFCDHYGVAIEGNVPPALDPQNEFAGKNILKQRRPLGETARRHGLTPAFAVEMLVASLEKLRAVRAQRPRPHLDDKIITAWNGLMISALARGAVSTAECLADKREFYREAAVRAAEFVRRELYDEGRGILYRCYREGRGANEGFAEDYAYFVAGLLDLYGATFEVRWLQWAERLQRTMDALFWDEKDGGYFNSRADDASIVLRLKEDYDGAEPSPNSVAAANLLRLAAILYEDTLRSRARRTIEGLRPRWAKTPHALPEMLCSIERALDMPCQVVIAGDPQAGDFQALAEVVRAGGGPRRALLAADGGAGQQWLASRAPWLAEMRPVAGRATAYVCVAQTCRAPVTEPEELRMLLAEG